ncbi:sensor histidine kinase [Paenibacillus sp. GD4]|jgi:two-component system, sensor histidine kinase YesM|uniref:cache domain-containing sensor histidine kinase n=1 Tax=Paenibacillus sp. GD4 TaxID=3068890 RepID=UPI002796B583|nr:sensor histidine kinase [Paenibacillus sp. GD4]MDQ1911733.1 sensor histidine kinase [Paenibacillus sp. GD4]
MSLRHKIMLGVLLLVFIPVIVMGGVTYYLFSGAIEEQTEAYYRSSLLETDRKIQYALGELNGISDLSITQPVVQQFLKQTRMGGLRWGDGMAERALLTELNNLLLSHPKITSLTLYNQNELVHTTGSGTALPLDSLRAQPWYAKVKALKGRPMWLGPYENDLLDGQQLTQVRMVKDYYSLEDIGTLVLTVRTDAIDHILWEAGTIQEGEMLVVNRDGTVIFSKSGKHLGEGLPFPFLTSTGERETFVEAYEGKETFITYHPSQVEGWYLIALTPIDNMYAEMIRIRNLAVGLILLTLFSVIVFDLLFLRKLVHTIIAVTKALKLAEAGSFTEVSMGRRAYQDESGLLVRGFNRMSRQIQELITRVEEEQRRKKEAELQALVAQINPHFIYNSLETINSMAVLQGNREISRLVISLGKLLRISISETQELIPIGTELEHVRHYLFIQTCRFGEKLLYELEAPEQWKYHLSLKLIVQPIVENALYHGIERLQGQGVIRIRLLESSGDLVVEVTDNGLGIEPERLEELFADKKPEVSKAKHRGVGMKNVHDRLRIRFGSRYGIIVCSSAGEGTVVRIRMPRITSGGGGGGAAG